MQGDNAQRSKAIPFEGLVSDNGAALTSLDGGNFYLAPDFTTQSRIFPIIITRPEAGRLVELRMTFRLHAASASGFGLKFALGTLSNDLYWDQATTQEQIDIMHRAITGKDVAYSVAANGELFIDDLDLLRVAPERGDTGFSSDAICLLFVFDSIPAVTTGWAFRDFRIHGSSQQGLL